MFTKKELITFGVVTLILAFIFGFNDGSNSLNTVNWINNFIKSIVLVGVSLLIAIWVQKKVAKSRGATTKLTLWSIRRVNPLWNPETKLKSGFPIGAILALFFTFLSQGTLFFTGIYSTVVEKSLGHLGRGSELLKEYDEALVLLAFPLTNIGIILIAKFLENSFGISLPFLITINMWLAIFNIIPIPGLIGGQMFFANKRIYLFALTFIILAIGLMSLGIIVTLILALLLSFLVISCYYYFSDFGGSIDWPNFTPMQRFSKAKNFKKWQFIILFLLLMILFSFLGTAAIAGTVISIILAFIILTAYYLFKK